MKSYIIIGVAAAIAIAAIFHPPGHSTPAVLAASASAPDATRRRPAAAKLLVYVAGAVAKAGLYRLSPGARAFEAVRLAGGLRADADPAGINLAEPLADGEEIAVPVLGATATHRARTAQRSTRRKKKSAAPAAADAQVDLNTADAQTLQQLPGVGAELAQRLVRFRDANGPFASVDELADVAGMTPRRIDALAPYVTVNR